MANQVVSDEARGGGGGGASTVWKHFHRNVVVSGAGAGSGCTATCRCGTTATCRRCGTMLKACPRKHGTSHLHRHARSAACALRAQAQAQRVLIAPEPAADDALTWLEDHVVDGDVDVDGHLNIRSGAQEMQEAGCTKPCSPPNYVPLPQVSNSSSKRFLKKKRNRQVLLFLDPILKYKHTANTRPAAPGETAFDPIAGWSEYNGRSSVGVP